MMMLSAAGRQLQASTSEMTANEMLWEKCIVDTMLNFIASGTRGLVR